MSHVAQRCPVAQCLGGDVAPRINETRGILPHWSRVVPRYPALGRDVPQLVRINPPKGEPGQPFPSGAPRRGAPRQGEGMVLALFCIARVSGAM